MRVSVCFGGILIPEYLDSHSGYYAPRSRIARIYSQTNAPLILPVMNVSLQFYVEAILNV